jgi:hypothetical protein
VSTREAFLEVARAHRPEDPVSVPAGVLIALLGASCAADTPSAASPAAPDLTCAQVGERLGRASSTVRGWCERGELDGAYRWRGTKEWRIPLARLLEFEEAQRQGGRQAGERSHTKPKAVDLGAWRRATG